MGCNKSAIYCFVNGVLMQGLDVNHQEVVLTHSAKAGDEYRIDLHAYSGMKDSKVDLFAEVVSIDTKIRKLYYDIYCPCRLLESFLKMIRNASIY